MAEEQVVGSYSSFPANKLRRIGSLAVAASFALAGIACTGTGDAGADRSIEEGAAGKAGQDPAPSGSETKGGDVRAGNEPAAVPGVLEPLKNLTPKQERLSRASARIDDPPDDARVSGTVPGFVEILAGSVAGDGRNALLTLEMSGDVPETMPDDSTFMIVAWNLAGTKKHATVGITAQADQEGWHVSAGKNDELIEFPGTLSIEKRSITIEIPWRLLGIPRRFEWSAAATWQRVSDEGPSGSGDNIPSARFPGRRSG